MKLRILSFVSIAMVTLLMLQGCKSSSSSSGAEAPPSVSSPEMVTDPVAPSEPDLLPVAAPDVDVVDGGASDIRRYNAAIFTEVEVKQN